MTDFRFIFVGADFVSEKSPSNIDVAAELLSLFEDSFFINVVRDGRDVLLSHQKVRARWLAARKKAGGVNSRRARKWLKEFSSPNICRRWNNNIGQYFALRDVEALHHRVFLIRYEDLVRHPEEQIRRLCEQLGVTFETDMLRTEDTPDEETEYFVDDVWYTRQQFGQKINTEHVEKWRAGLPRSDAVLANVWMAANLKRLGYPVEPGYRKVRNVANRVMGR